MPNWKKVIVQGSDATLNTVTASNGINALDSGFIVEESTGTELEVQGTITASGHYLPLFLLIIPQLLMVLLYMIQQMDNYILLEVTVEPVVVVYNLTLYQQFQMEGVLLMLLLLILL